MRLLLHSLVLAAVAFGQDAREIIRQAVERDRGISERARNYTFLQRQEVRKLDGSGKAKETEILTHEVTLLEGSPYYRLVARNDQPLSPAEQKQEDEKLRQNNEARRKETPEQRERRVAE